MTDRATIIISVDRSMVDSDNSYNTGDRYGFLICTSGNGVFVTNTGRWTVEKDEILIFGPRSRVSVDSASDDMQGLLCMAESKVIMPAVNTLAVSEQFLFISNNPVVRPAEADLAVIESLIRLLTDRLATPDRPLSDRFSESVVRAIIYTVLTVYYEKRSAVPGPRTRRDALYFEFEADLKKFVSERRDAAFYADRLHITPHYLATVVRAVTGRSLKTRISEAVLTEAYAMLSDTDNNIKQIAFQLGFTSQTFFGRYFKRLTGMSPLQYRKKINK